MIQGKENKDIRNVILSNNTKYIKSLFLHTLFPFGLTTAPIQNTGLINAKYNDALYGTIIILYNK